MAIYFDEDKVLWITLQHWGYYSLRIGRKAFFYWELKDELRHGAIKLWGYKRLKN